MKNDQSKKYRCKRCNRVNASDIICQACKNELLSNYEASFDWQTAFEIERAQLTASRYRNEELDDIENFY